MAHACTDCLGVAARAAPRPPPPPPARSSIPWRRYHVRSTLLRGGEAVAASIARAVVGRLGFAARHGDRPIIPPIPSSPTVALNVNECGTVSSLLFYQLFTHLPPPFPPPWYFCLSLPPRKNPEALEQGTSPRCSPRKNPDQGSPLNLRNHSLFAHLKQL
jgi:hypothetical protein